MGSVARRPKHWLRKRSQLEIITVDAKVAMNSANFKLKVARNMRAYRLLIPGAILSCTVTVSAQSTTSANQPPGVSVLNGEWEKGRLPVKTKTPYDLTDPNTNQVNENKQVLPPDSQRDLRRIDGSFPEDVKEKMRRDAKALDYAYFYSIQVKNEGPKKIRSLAWDYVFSDPGSKQELKRQSFRTFVAVGINQTKMDEGRPNAGSATNG